MNDAEVDYLFNGFQGRAVPVMESEKFLIEFKEPDENGRRSGSFVANAFQQAIDGAISPQQLWHLILKPRQVGISTYIDLRALVEALCVEGTRAVIVSHEKTATTRLLRKVHLTIKNLKERRAIIGGEPVETEFASKFEITFPRKRSYLYIGTAGQKAFSRGDSITFFHGSEVAFWENAAELMEGVVGALVSSAEVFLESTANGMGGYFYDLVKECLVPGAGPALLHFFPWHLFPEYATKPPPQVVWSAEEMVLARRFRLTQAQLWWRRNKMGKYKHRDTFYQEFPMTVDEAFIVAGACFFEKESLREMQNRVMARDPLLVGTIEAVGPRAVLRAATSPAPKPGEAPAPDRLLSVYEHARADHSYVIGVDSSEGVDGADPVSACVLDRDRCSEAAWLSGILDPNEYAKALFALGQLYNWAWIGVEDNGPGLAVLMALVTLGYPRIYKRVDPMDPEQKPRLGWHTDPRTRPLMLGTLRSMMKTRVWAPASAQFVKQCTTFCRQNDGNYRANSGAHDDDVMAAAIAAYLHTKLPVDIPPAEQERESRILGNNGQPIRRGHKTGY